MRIGVCLCCLLAFAGAASDVSAQVGGKTLVPVAEGLFKNGAAVRTATGWSKTGAVGTKSVSAFKLQAARMTDALVGREQLKPFSLVGKERYNQKVAVAEKLHLLGINQKIVRAIENKGWSVPLFAGYYRDFNAALKAYYKTHGQVFPLASMAEQLARMMPQGTVFFGTFAGTFDDVAALSFAQPQGQGSAYDALRNAFSLGIVENAGFPVVVAAGKGVRARDVFLLDIANLKWISLNQSKAKEIAKDHLAFRRDNPVLAERLDKQGIVVKYAEKTNKAMLSTNGVTWVECNDPDVLYAWDKGYYIEFNPQTHQASFAFSRGEPLIRDLAGLRLAANGKVAGLDYKITENGSVELIFPYGILDNVYVLAAGTSSSDLYTPDREILSPVVYMKDVNMRGVTVYQRPVQGALLPLAGQTAATPESYSQVVVEDFFALKRIALDAAARDPQRRLLYKMPANRKYFDSVLSVQFISKDGRFLSDYLETVQLYDEAQQAGFKFEPLAGRFGSIVIIYNAYGQRRNLYFNSPRDAKAFINGHWSLKYNPETGELTEN